MTYVPVCKFISSAIAFGLLALCCVRASAADEAAVPSLRDLQLAASILGFQSPAPSGDLSIAVVFDERNPQSHEEATAIVALVGNGLTVGGLTLHAIAISQNGLAAAGPFGALFETASVDDALLKSALLQRHVPCLTRHPDQVTQGACIVAIQAKPPVIVTINHANSEAASVRFATAFRMMVREI